MKTLKVFTVCALLLVCSDVFSSPTRITDLSVTNIAGVTLTLHWTTPTGAISNDVRMSTSPITTLNWASKTRVTGLDNVPGTAGALQTALVTGLSVNTTYYFAIKTCDSGNAWSTMSNLVFTRTRGGTAGVNLAWDRSLSGDVTNYTIYTYWPSNTTYLTNITVAGNTTLSAVTNLPYGTTLTFFVTASSSLGESDPSDEITYTTP